MVHKKLSQSCKDSTKEKDEDRIPRKNLRIVYSNVDGLTSKKGELDELIKEKTPEIICLSETKLPRDVDAKVFGWKNYNVWRKDREKKFGGGVMILTHIGLNVKMLQLESNSAEIVGIEVKDGHGDKVDVVVCYIPPYTRTWKRDEHEQLRNDSVATIQRLIDRKNRIIVMGDFNCGEVDWENMDAGNNEESWGNRLMELVMENTLTQIIKEKTRIRGEDEPSRLDLVFTKDPNDIKNVAYRCPLGKSDHLVIEMEVSGISEGERNEKHRECRYNYKKTNFISLRKFFQDVNWNKINEFENIDKKYEFLMEIYNTGVTKYVPKFGKAVEKKNDWFNNKCMKAQKERNRAWDKVRKQYSKKAWENYKKARNEYVRVRREEERQYEKDIVSKSKKEPKLFYRYVNGKMKVKDSIARLRDGDETYEREEDLCEIMNNKLQSVYVSEGEFIEPPVEPTTTKMKEIVVGKNEVLQMMRDLDVRKAMGPDNMAGWILKECADQLVLPIHSIIKSSLETGQVPKDWKRSNIVPIFKGGDREDPLNYRPVSLTSVVCKICEKIIRKRWIRYLEGNEMISQRQFGFREGRSCVTNLVSFYSRVIDVVQEREGWADCVYLDLRKAFDKVPHKRLLWKLKTFGGIHGKLLKWMKEYLTGRQMRTVIRDKVSKWKEVASGVPQGSVLAPIMFLIYVNDLPEGLSSYMSMFADDAKIMRHIKSIESCRELQEDLDKLHVWSQTWKMEFNAKKCHVLEMGVSDKRPNWTYKIGNEVISKKREEKDLGVIVQDNLSPEKHISRIIGGAYGLLTNMRVAFNYMDEEMLRELIVSMIRPRLEYAAVVWSPHLKKHINKLERVQRMATKMIPDLRELTYAERLEKLQLPTLYERRERGDQIAMFRNVKGLEKLDRQDLFVLDDGRTRGHEYKLRKSRCLNDHKKFSFPNRSINIWNDLEEEVVNAKSINMFKNRLDSSRYGGRTTRA